MVRSADHRQRGADGCGVRFVDVAPGDLRCLRRTAGRPCRPAACECALRSGQRADRSDDPCLVPDGRARLRGSAGVAVCAVAAGNARRYGPAGDDPRSCRPGGRRDRTGGRRLRRVFRGAALAGGALAGVLIAWLGPAPLLFVDGATFLASAILISSGVPRVAHDDGDGAAGGYLTRLGEGLAFLWRERLLRAAGALLLIPNMLDIGVHQVVLPAYPRHGPP